MDQPTDDAALFDSLASTHRAIQGVLAQRIVGQSDVIEELLIALFARGHCLLVGVPGLAKTLLVNTLARGLGLDFGRIQFTPDLMPADIVGTDVLEEDRQSGRRVQRFLRGPIFTHLLLADEINRTPPKTQAALLQAMQESQVTAGGTTHVLEPPFMVFATQNPIEQEGTYPLPEAEQDRFMFAVEVGYPSELEEIEVVKRTTVAEPPPLAPVLDRERLVAYQALVRRLPTHDDVTRYAVRLARASRPGPTSPEFVRRFVRWGAGPRASQYLVLGARVRAALRGHEVPDLDDVRAVAPSVLRHRIQVGFLGEAEGVTSRDVVHRLLEEVGRP